MDIGALTGGGRVVGFVVLAAIFVGLLAFVVWAVARTAKTALKDREAHQAKLAGMSPEQRSAYESERKQAAQDARLAVQYRAGNQLGVKSPACGSDLVSHISGSAKAGKVALFGIFALGGLGKTFQCGRCRYRW